MFIEVKYYPDSTPKLTGGSRGISVIDQWFLMVVREVVGC